MRGNEWAGTFYPTMPGILLQEYRERKENILVIAPHPDDDILGVGGTMTGACEQGKGVFSAYLTDGRGSPRKDKSISDEQMARCRQNEAILALQVVGAVGGFFMKACAEELGREGGRKVEKELEEILQFIRPEEVFLPTPYERHRTHQRCTRLSIEALRKSGVKTTLLGYSLWGSFWGGKKRVVQDITPFIKKKEEAVLAHASQTAYKNYLQGILGKNKYEAVFWESHEIQKSTFVEIFLDMTELIEKKDLTLEAFMRQDFEAFLQTFSYS